MTFFKVGVVDLLVILSYYYNLFLFVNMHQNENGEKYVNISEPQKWLAKT